MAILKPGIISKTTLLMATLFAILSFTQPAVAKQTKTTPDSVAAKINKLPEKERLFVVVNTIVTSNVALAALVTKTGEVHGSIDEQEALVLTLSKADFMGKVAEKSVPGKLTAYFTDWHKAVKSYLDGKITFQDFVQKRKQLHPQLVKILSANMKQEEAQKFGKKHSKFIEELSTEFYKPAVVAVHLRQKEAIKNNANFANTKCLPVKDKWKKCGLTGDIKPLIAKINPKLAGGNAKIYQTMRIGNKFVVYVFYGQTKKQMKDTIKELQKTQPATLQATYTLTALRSLCQDNNYKQVLKKTKTIGQLIVHSIDTLPVYNLVFKDCGDLKKFQTEGQKK